MRFKIIWRDGNYLTAGPYVAGSNHNGGEVVTLDEVQEIEAQRDRALAALREIRCWAGRGHKTPEQAGAQCDTLGEALRQADAALSQQAQGASK